MRDDCRLHDDATLLAAGDSSAFAEFYERYALTVCRYFATRTGCAETAADLAADTFAIAYVSQDRFEHARGEPRQWLFGIAANLLRSHRRQLWTRRQVLCRFAVQSELAEDASVALVEVLDARRAASALRPALGALPVGQRAAISLRIVSGLPFDEVAQRLECSPGAARVRVSRALAALRRSAEGCRVE